MTWNQEVEQVFGGRRFQRQNWKSSRLAFQTMNHGLNLLCVDMTSIHWRTCTHRERRKICLLQWVRHSALFSGFVPFSIFTSMSGHF
jgi:hypothetical protein